MTLNFHRASRYTGYLDLKKSVAHAKSCIRYAGVRRSISAALIGDREEGKRYNTVWHDVATRSAIYYKWSRFEPMINDHA